MAAVPLPEIAYRLIGQFSVTRFGRVLHPILYRLSGGRSILGRVLGGEVILLTTTGRRTGRPRTVALFGWREASGWAVIASRGGSRTIPSWYRNLAADPDVFVQAGGARFAAKARELTESDYEAAFERAALVYPGYRLYRRESPVHIPIVLLQSRDGVGGSVR